MESPKKSSQNIIEDLNLLYIGNAWWLRPSTLKLVFLISVCIYIFGSKKLALILILWPLMLVMLRVGHKRGFFCGYHAAQEDRESNKS